LIFVDTSFWFALRTQRDEHHHEARELLLRYGQRGFVTSNHVRGETWTLLCARNGHTAAAGYLNGLAASPRIRVDHVNERLEQEALDWLLSHDEYVYSFVDATSFVLMRELGISEALTFDRDFAAAGFVVPRAL